MPLSDTQIADLIRSEKPANIARRAFATYAAKLYLLIDDPTTEWDTQEKREGQYVRMNRLEFEAVDAIARALGLLLPDLAAERPADPGADAASLASWLQNGPSGPRGPSLREALSDPSGAVLPAGSREAIGGPENVAGRVSGEPVPPFSPGGPAVKRPAPSFSGPTGGPAGEAGSRPSGKPGSAGEGRDDGA